MDSFGLPTPTCNQCGSQSTRQGSLQALLAIATPQQAQALSEGAAWLHGIGEGSGELTAWFCRRCDNVGVRSAMSPFTFG